MNTFTTTFFEFLLRASGQAIVIVALVLLVQHLARHRISPAARHALWWLVIVRLLIPWFPESSVSVFNLGPNEAPFITTVDSDMVRQSHRVSSPPLPNLQETSLQELSADGEVLTPEPVELSQSTPSLGGTHTPPSMSADPMPRLELNTSSSISSTFKGNKIIAGTWLLGVILMLLQVIVGCWRISFSLRKEVTVVDLQALDQMRTACRRFGLRKTIPMIETDQVSSPALFGFISPVLLLPRKALRSYTPSELNHIIMHELGHVRRRDHWLNWLMTFCQILHWFNPGIWFAFGRMRADRELATDHLALKTNGDQDATAYGQTILKTLRHMARPSSIPGLVGILEDKRHLKNRFEMMAAYLPHRRFSWALFLVFAVPLTVVTLTNPARGQDTEQANPQVIEEATTPVEIFKTIRIQVVDAETNTPIENANLQWWTGFPMEKQQGKTDSDGYFEIDLPPIPESYRAFSITTGHDDHVARIINWHWLKSSYEGDWDSILPNSLTVKLSKGFEIGGKVQDDNGNPLPDVQIQIAAYGTTGIEWEDGGLQPTIHDLFLDNGRHVETNRDGRWEASHLPKDAHSISMKFIRTDGSETIFTTQLGMSPDPDYRGDANPISIGDLKAKEAVFHLKDTGITIQGKVIDNLGNSIAGATVTESYGAAFNKIQTHIQTDAQGRFTFSNRRSRQVSFTASHDGFAITSIDTTIKPNMGPVTIQMLPAQPLSGFVNDSEGVSISNATIMTDYDFAGRTFEWRVKTDENGAFTWNQAPLNKVMFLIAKDGYPVRRIRMQPRSEPWTIVLDQAAGNQITLKARVTDGITGSPIPNFDYVVKADWNPNVFPSPSQESGENGTIETILTKNIFNPDGLRNYRLVVDAPGFERWQSEFHFFEEGNMKLEASLVKDTRGNNVSGRVVLDPEGNPVSVANVVLVGVPYYHGLPFINKTWVSDERENSVSVYTNSKGEIPPVRLPDNFRGIFIFDDSGHFFTLKEEMNFPDNAIRLKPYGKLEGQIDFGNKFIKDRLVCITNRDWISNPLFAISLLTRPDTEGKFTFPELAEGDYCLFLMKGNQNGAVIETYQTSVSVQSSETTSMRFRDEGRHVIGKIETIPDTAEISWPSQQGFLHLIDSSNTPPTRPKIDEFVSIEEFRKAEESWRRDPEIIALRRNKRSYFLDFNKDGSFTATSIRPGKYELSIILTQENLNLRNGFLMNKKDLGSLHREIEIPDGPLSELVDLGSFDLHIAQP